MSAPSPTPKKQKKPLRFPARRWAQLAACAAVCGVCLYGAVYALSLIHILEHHGYRQYEISNFAKPGYEGRHNLIYWDCGDYLGLGQMCIRDRSRGRLSGHSHASETGHSIARPIACGNRVPPQRTHAQGTPGQPLTAALPECCSAQ